MSEIQPISAATAPVQNTVKDNGPQNEQLTKAREHNNSTAKTCAYVALGTSIATLLPLSLLAIKTGKISKAADAVQKGVNGVISEGITPVLDSVKKMTVDPQKMLDAMTKSLEEFSGFLKTEECKGILAQIKGKIADVDGKAIGEMISEHVQQIGAILKSRAENANLEPVNELIANISAKLDGVDISGLSKEGAAIFRNMVAKLRGVEGIVESATARLEESAQMT